MVFLFTSILTFNLICHQRYQRGNNKNDAARSSSDSRATLLELVVKNKRYIRDS